VFRQPSHQAECTFPGTFRIIKFACKVITNYEKNKGEIRKKKGIFRKFDNFNAKKYRFWLKGCKNGVICRGYL